MSVFKIECTFTGHLQKFYFLKLLMIFTYLIISFFTYCDLNIFRAKLCEPLQFSESNFVHYLVAMHICGNKSEITKKKDFE